MTRAGVMTVDPVTLRDLEVFSSLGADGMTLFALLDRTHSHAGRDALHRRLSSPVSDAERIVELQSAHRFLAQESSAVRAGLNDAGLDACQAYLSSRWETARSQSGLTRAAEAAWLRLRGGPFLQDVGRGCDQVLALIAAATRLGDVLADAPSDLVRQHGRTIRAAIETPELVRLRDMSRARSAASGILALDRLARGPAKPVLQGLVLHLADIEAMWSLAVATAEQGWSYPTLSPGGCSVHGLVHPFLGRQGISNDLVLDPATRVCFLTGPNMAGKSTFLKAFALAIYLAHLGCAVPARAMAFRPSLALFSSVQVSDNLSAGESFYLAEVHRIRALAELLGRLEPAVAVVDEPFRGTNVHDATEATLALVTRLAAHPNALAFVASHIVEVVSGIETDPRVRLLHFAAGMEGEGPVFDYALREGASRQRLGMTLLRREGVLDLLSRW